MKQLRSREGKSLAQEQSCCPRSLATLVSLSVTICTSETVSALSILLHWSFVYSFARITFSYLLLLSHVSVSSKHQPFAFPHKS